MNSVPDVFEASGTLLNKVFKKIACMPSVTNQNESGKLEPGVVLTVKGAESENEAILAIENYLRENKQEHLEVAVRNKGEDGVYEIALE